MAGRATRYPNRCWCGKRAKSFMCSRCLKAPRQVARIRAAERAAERATNLTPSRET